MGKVLITDEGNNGYTVDVIRAGCVRAIDAGASYKHLTSAVASASQVVRSTGAWLKSVIIGGHPATATVINIYNSSGALSALAVGTPSSTSCQNIIARLIVGVTGASANNELPRDIPFNIYCASGISVGLGDTPVNMGNLDGVTVVYQD